MSRRALLLLLAAFVLPAERAAAQAVAPGAPVASGSSAAPTPAEPVSLVAVMRTPLELSRAQARRLQRGIGVRADGAVGARTRAALKRWEHRQGLQADGRPDPEVLGRLGIDLTREQLVLLFPTAAAPAAAGSAVEVARVQIGTPYRTAGTAPGGFDCSGLTMYAFGRAGILLPHSSFSQFELGTPVDRAAIQAGDLVFFDSAGPGASDVGIATGPATVISATTRGVREHATFDTYWGGHFVGARRVVAAP